MSMKKLEMLDSLRYRVPIAGHRAIDWLERMGIDDDTTAEELDRYDTLLYGIDQQGWRSVLFAVLDTKRVNGVEQFEKLVDEVHAGRWVLDEDITSVYQLHYYLKHDYEEKPDAMLSIVELLDGDTDPTLGKEKLAEQERWEQGGLSCFGWVYYSEA